MNNIKKAEAYSSALFEIAKDNKIDLDKFNQDIKELVILLDGDNNLVKFLTNNQIDNENKKELINNVFQKNLSTEVLNAIKLMIDKNICYILKDTMRLLVKEINNELNIINGQVYTIEKIDNDTVAKIQNKIGTKLNKKVYLENIIDKELIGGTKIIVEDQVWDGSVLNKINSLAKSIKEKEMA